MTTQPQPPSGPAGSGSGSARRRENLGLHQGHNFTLGFIVRSQQKGEDVERLGSLAHLRELVLLPLLGMRLLLGATSRAPSRGASPSDSSPSRIGT